MLRLLRKTNKNFSLAQEGWKSNYCLIDYCGVVVVSFFLCGLMMIATSFVYMGLFPTVIVLESAFIVFPSPTVFFSEKGKSLFRCKFEKEFLRVFWVTVEYWMDKKKWKRKFSLHIVVFSVSTYVRGCFCSFNSIQWWQTHKSYFKI